MGYCSSRENCTSFRKKTYNWLKMEKLTAVASRSLDRAKEFASDYGAEYAYGSYQELFNTDKVDVLYIATPHTSHCNLTIEALNHGKPVLCEKPMGVNMSQVQSMLKKAREKSLFDGSAVE